MDMNPEEMATVDAPIQDFLDVLERHRIECERSGKYEEAELARTRLEQLRRHEESRRREELRSQQLAERLGVEEAHMTELQEFNEIWDRKAAEFEAHAATLQNTLAARHQAEHQEHLERLRRETEPRTPRWSKDLLNLRRIQEILAKQKKYAEAEKTKLQADRVESEEHRMWKVKREAKIESLEKQFLHKQQLEMGGLLKRIQSGREEQKQARKGELERLLQGGSPAVALAGEERASVLRLRTQPPGSRQEARALIAEAEAWLQALGARAREAEAAAALPAEVDAPALCGWLRGVGERLARHAAASAFGRALLLHPRPLLLRGMRPRPHAPRPEGHRRARLLDIGAARSLAMATDGIAGAARRTNGSVDR